MESWNPAPEPNPGGGNSGRQARAQRIDSTSAGEDALLIPNRGQIDASVPPHQERKIALELAARAESSGPGQPGATRH